MKTKSKILITLLIAALCMPAQAQFGGLLNKAKEKAKEAVTKEAKKTVEKKVVRNSGVEESASSSADAQNAPTATSNPNAKDIDPILRVSMSALNESYKKLDFNTYYTLFYDEPGMFYTKSFDETQKVHNLMEQFVIYLMSSGKDSPPMVYKTERNRHILPAEYIINSGFAVYRAFPKETYPMLVEARTLLHAMEKGKINIDYEKPNTMVAYFDNDKLMYTTSDYVQYGYGFKDAMIVGAGSGGEAKAHHITRWKEEEARLMELYRKNVPFENVKNTFINTMVYAANARKENRIFNAYYWGAQLETISEDMKNHPQKVEDDDYTSSLAAYENMKNSISAWETAIKNAWAEELATYKLDDGTAGIPKAAISNPKLEAEMIAIAKGIYDDGRVPVKAIIKYPDWNYTRNALGGIIDRYHTAFIIFKMKDGTHRMVDIGFKQLYNGGSYGKTQVRGVGMINSVVDYK